MELQHVNVKLRVHDASAPAALEPLVAVFHGWIQDHVCPEQLVDVADYRHVPAGPGVMLIGHEANYSLDGIGKEWGVRYNRKTGLEGTTQDRFTQAARAALEACQRLESDGRLKGAVKFDGRQVQVMVNDRLLAPNTEATRKAAEPELKRFFDRLFGSQAYTLTYEAEPRRLFAVTATAAAAQDTATLLRNLGN